LILWHLCNEGLVFSHNLLAWKNHGNLTGFNIPQDFVTFGVQKSCKLLQFKHFLGTSYKIKMKGLQQIFQMMHYGQRRKGLNSQICIMCTTFDALLSSLLDPLEGLSMLNCGKLELGAALDFRH
jgi:hypothetical protein